MSKVDSPCLRQCALNNENICISCFRSLNEITQWSSACDTQKIDILALSRERQKQHKS